MSMLKEGLEINVDELFPNLEEKFPYVWGVKCVNKLAREKFAYNQFNIFYVNYVDICKGKKMMYLPREFYTEDNRVVLEAYMKYARVEARRRVRMMDKDENCISLPVKYSYNFIDNRFDIIRKLFQQGIDERLGKTKRKSKKQREIYRRQEAKKNKNTTLCLALDSCDDDIVSIEVML